MGPVPAAPVVEIAVAEMVDVAVVAPDLDAMVAPVVAPVVVRSPRSPRCSCASAGAARAGATSATITAAEIMRLKLILHLPTPQRRALRARSPCHTPGWRDSVGTHGDDRVSLAAFRAMGAERRRLPGRSPGAALCSEGAAMVDKPAYRTLLGTFASPEARKRRPGRADRDRLGSARAQLACRAGPVARRQYRGAARRGRGAPHPRAPRRARHPRRRAGRRRRRDRTSGSTRRRRNPSRRATRPPSRREHAGRPKPDKKD